MSLCHCVIVPLCYRFKCRRNNSSRKPLYTSPSVFHQVYSIECTPPSVLYRAYSTECSTESVFHRVYSNKCVYSTTECTPTSVLHRVNFTKCTPPSALYRVYSAECIPSSVLHRVYSTKYTLPSVLCRQTHVFHMYVSSMYHLKPTVIERPFQSDHLPSQSDCLRGTVPVQPS